MSKKYLYYSPLETVIDMNAQLPGVENFASFFKFFNPSVVVIDRTGIFQTPVNTESLFPMPKFRIATKSFETICNERAVELLVRAEKADLPLYVFYSGGIDSTLVLVSLLNVATVAQKKRIIVLMSEESIFENPNFYNDHIKNKLRVEASGMFQSIIGTNCILIGGEHNDQLMGSDKLLEFINRFGEGIIHKPYSRDDFFTFFKEKMKSDAHAKIWIDILEKLVAAAPVPITTTAQFLWWLNFATKWQSVFLRMLIYVNPRNAPKITKEYLSFNYTHFYNTEDFQLWSMNNTENKIKDTWKTYKWVCKEVIYDYTKDADYRDNKTKKGSLNFLIQQQEPFNFLDSDYNLHPMQGPEDWYNPNNNFLP